MNPLPYVYVVTVCRNAEPLIGATMQSVLNQTYGQVRYVVVDGASTDATMRVVEAWRERLAVVVSEPDRGIYDAMNKALRLVRRHMAQTGVDDAWVNFMNAGDAFAQPDVVERLFAHRALGPEVKVVGGATHVVYPDHVELLPPAGGAATAYALPYCHQSMFVRLTADFDWHFDTDYRIAADYALTYDIYRRFGVGAFLTVDDVVADYRMDGSTTFDHLRRAKREYLSIQSDRRTWRWWREWLKWLLHVGS